MTTPTAAEAQAAFEAGRHATLAEALAAFQAEVPKMSKDETAKVKSEKANYTYGYAGLDQFVEIVEPVLGKHGLSVTSAPNFDEHGRYVLTVTLLHESGEERSGVWPLPDPYSRGVGPQDIGSSSTYGRRYIAWGLTGTFPGGVDDDGKQAQQSARDSWEDARPARRPVEDRQAMAGEEPQAAPSTDRTPAVPTDDDMRGWLEKMPTANLDAAIRVYDWMAGKDLHKRTVDLDHQGVMVPVTATDLIAGRIADEAMRDGTTVRGVMVLRARAEDRGLLKIQVSETETLDESLHSASELARFAESEDPKGVADAAVIAQSAVE